MRLSMAQKINHGETWLANFNPSHGTDSGKIKPVLVIQSQALLDCGSPTTIIIPLTTKLHDNAEPLPLRISAQKQLKEDSDLMLDQIRAIDNKRLVSGPLASGHYITIS